MLFGLADEWLSESGWRESGERRKETEREVTREGSWLYDDGYSAIVEKAGHHIDTWDIPPGWPVSWGMAPWLHGSAAFDALHPI